MKYEEIRNPVIQQTGRDPYVAWSHHKAGAKRRGIGFELSFIDWWSLWEPHFANRGRGRHKLVMCRTGDKGPYAIGNVRIAPSVANIREAHRIAQDQAMRDAWEDDDCDNRSASDWLHDRMAIAAY